jgi:SulP family sulfate permease
LGLIHGLRTDNIRGDIYGGITAAIVALPLALAFGVASGAGPIAGMYGAIFVGLFAALFGGTPSQISGPTGPMTVVMGAIITDFVARDPEYGMSLAFTVVMLGGLFQIMMGVMKLGRYISLVPFPVVSGFMSGIGFIIILIQIGPFLGHPAPAGGPLASMLSIPEFVLHTHNQTLILGLLTLAIVCFLPNRINQLGPAPLLALLVGTLTLLYIFPGSGVTTLGTIPTGLPTPHLPIFRLDLLLDMIKAGFTLALLGAIDSLLTSLVADNITRTHHDSDRELVGQGIGNLIGGLFGGLPGAGATMRTVINVRAGGNTPISGVLHAFVLLSIVLGAGSLAENIPHAVLAGILIKVGIDIIDWDFFKRIRTTSRPAIALMATVLLITVFVDLITAVAVGVIGASMLLVNRMAALQLENMKIFTSVDETISLSDVEKDLFQQAREQILLCHLTGPLSFGAAKGMTRRLASFDRYQILLLDLTNVPTMDFTSSKAIEDIIHDASGTGRLVYLVGLGAQTVQALARVGIPHNISNTYLFQSRRDALEQALRNMQQPTAT